ncbi:MAG: VanZ family protein [Bacteroidales bacterium]|nr:VanZ family protein [Bacteroidales bacterium]
MTRQQLTWARILFGLYLVAVAVLCFGKFDSSQDVPMDLWGIPTDKLVHFLMFFPFPLLACLASGGYRGERWLATFRTVIAFLAGCAFAAATEWIQTWLSYRSGDPADFGADALALLLSSIIVLFIVLSKHRK